MPTGTPTTTPPSLTHRLTRNEAVIDADEAMMTIVFDDPSLLSHDSFEASFVDLMLDRMLVVRRPFSCDKMRQRACTPLERRVCIRPTLVKTGAPPL